MLDSIIARSISWIPKPIVRRVASRYVAGETLDHAIAVGKSLNNSRCLVTFDLLGEFITDESSAEANARDYIEILERIQRDGLSANVSIKLSAFGLLIDEKRTLERVRRVVERAAALGNFVRIDMEDSKCTDATLRIYRALRDEGRSNVGVVVQAYLKRTSADVSAFDTPGTNFRLCKGIYVEPPDIAFKDPEEIRRSYRSLLEQMLTQGAYVGIATHDAALVDSALETIRVRGLKPETYEFQMLLGVTERLRDRVLDAGHRLRVYVPFGRDWYGYCVRRLKENPKIGRYVFLALLGKKG